MPVVNVTLGRLKKFLPGVKVERALDMLPFVGLDIEGVDGDLVRVEYNPNRPDFSSDYGIARALAGLVGKESGMPKFRLAGRSGLVVKAHRSVKETRPFVVALVAKNGKLDDETIKQLIAMQEDLHNGVGRRRKKASIGMHNLDAIKFPVRYYATADGGYSFVPLGGSQKQTVKQMLKETETGRTYGHLLAGVKRYPIIADSAGTALSLPPIINGDATKVDERCRNLFIEVTATDKKTADDVLAIIAITLFDAGFQIKTVTVLDGSKRQETPDAATRKMSVDAAYVNDILGLNLTAKEIARCLKKSRLDAKATGNGKIVCTIPRYRTDITHEIDLAEEAAIGYGVYRMEPNFPVSPTSGQRSALSSYFAAIRQSMTGLGMLESSNFSLTSREVQYSLCGRPEDGGKVLAVNGTKSSEHEVLRSSLVPSLLQSLSRNVHEEYPQWLFEIGKTFHVQGDGGKIVERWHVSAVTAHGEAGYTEIKSAMQALLSSGFGMPVAETKATDNPLYIRGRCASVVMDNKVVGTIGEITPLAIDNFKLRVPVAAFEIDLSALLPL